MTKNVKVNLKDKIAEKVYDLIKPYLDDVQDDHSDLKDHVDELEEEFRHEVHGIQENVLSDYELQNTISDQVSYKMSEYIEHYFTNLGIDLEEASGVSDKVEELVSELQEIGENLSRVG